MFLLKIFFMASWPLGLWVVTAEPLLTDNSMFSWRFLHLVWVVFTRFQVLFVHGQTMCLGIFISFYLFKIVGIPMIVASLLYDKWDCLSHNGVVTPLVGANESHERERGGKGKNGPWNQICSCKMGGLNWIMSTSRQQVLFHRWHQSYHTIRGVLSTIISYYILS